MINAGIRLNSSPLAEFNITTLAWDNISVTVVYPNDDELNIQDYANNKIKADDIIIDTLAKVWKVTSVIPVGKDSFSISIMLANSNIPTGFDISAIVPNIGDTKACVLTLINNKASPYWNASYVDASIHKIATTFNNALNLIPRVLVCKELLTSINTHGLSELQTSNFPFSSELNILNYQTVRFVQAGLSFDLPIVKTSTGFAVDFNLYLDEINTTNLNNSEIYIEYFL